MKTKKFNLNWQSVLLGMVLCLVLVVFVGSRGQSTVEAQSGVIQKAVSMSALMDKSELIDQRILILETKITYLTEKVDYTVTMLNKIWERGK